MTLTAGVWAESPSSGAGMSVGVGGCGVSIGVPVPTTEPDSVRIGNPSTPFACTNAALIQPLPSGPARNSICNHAPFASLPISLATSCGLSVPTELKSAPGPLRTFNCCWTMATFPSVGFASPPPITGTSGGLSLVMYCEVTQPFSCVPAGYRICHQLSPGSLPMISTFVFGGIMPSTALAVDGSARTLSCVDETPSTGATVGAGAGGSGDSVGAAVSVDGNVAVRIPALAPGVSVNRVAEAVCVGLTFIVQLLIIRKKMILDKMRLDLTL